MFLQYTFDPCPIIYPIQGICYDRDTKMVKYSIKQLLLKHLKILERNRARSHFFSVLAYFIFNLIAELQLNIKLM